MDENVSFGSTKVVGVLGMLIGGLFAIGVPYVVLAPEIMDRIGVVAPILLALVGILGGVALAIVTGFFSLVVPANVSKQKGREKDKPKDTNDTEGEAKDGDEATDEEEDKEGEKGN